MDREVVLVGLCVATIGMTLAVSGLWSRAVEPTNSARQWERALWRAIWWPIVPAIIVVSVLLGWAIVEPAESDELLPSSILFVGGFFVCLWLRAAIRATLALRAREPEIAGTVGVWRTRMVVSGDLRARLDSDALAAVMAHEAAHIRHRDPLRIWLAQIITDLQWPWPAARRRFDRWRHVLELARDEDARLAGVDGADLAAAILLAARLHASCATGATLIDDRHGLEARIDRLLAPLPPEESHIKMANPAALLPVALVGMLSGVRFGEAFVQLLVKSLP